jgi:hypothetical protein
MPVSKGRLLIVTIWWGKKLVKKRQTTDSHDMVGEKTCEEKGDY